MVEGQGAEFVTARDAALRQLFRPGELVWQTDARYDATELLWDVDLVRSGPQARWMLQRYSYDSSAQIVHFRGERPLSDEEFAALRQAGKRLS